MRRYSYKTFGVQWYLSMKDTLNTGHLSNEGTVLFADDKYYNQNVQMRRTAGEDYRLAHRVAQKLQQQESQEEEERQARWASGQQPVVAILCVVVRLSTETSTSTSP